LHGFSGPLGLKGEFWGQNKGRGGAILTPQRTRSYFSGFFRLCQFWWKSIKKCDRESAHRRTDRQTQTDFIICPMLYAIAMGQIIIEEMVLCSGHITWCTTDCGIDSASCCSCCYSFLPPTLSYGDCLEVKREYYQNCCVLGCVTQCSQSVAHSCEQFLQVQQIGFVTLGPLRCA